MRRTLKKKNKLIGICFHRGAVLPVLPSPAKLIAYPRELGQAAKSAVAQKILNRASSKQSNRRHEDKISTQFISCC